MKKLLFILMVAAAMVVPVNADYYLAGGFNGWDPAGQLMTDNLDGTYSATVSGLAAGEYQHFKVTDGTWGTAYPSADSWFSANASGEVDITFNTNTVSDGWVTEQFRVGISTEPGTWSLVGDFNGWNNNDPAQAMADLGGGIYAITQTFDAGDWNLKPVVTGSWDGIGTEGRSMDAWNYYLSLAAASEVTVSVDAFAGIMKVEVVPEPATMALLGLGSLIAARRRKK